MEGLEKEVKIMGNMQLGKKCSECGELILNVCSKHGPFCHKCEGDEFGRVECPECPTNNENDPI